MFVRALRLNAWTSRARRPTHSKKSAMFTRNRTVQTSGQGFQKKAGQVQVSGQGVPET
jgi:hypothetical protein